MKLLVTVQKWMHVWCLFSVTALHSASAGGAYCAKTARARAAALGLEYPGVHGAPALSSPAHYVKQPRAFSYDDMPLTPANVGTYAHYQPGGSPFDMTYHPRSSDRILPWVQGGSHTNQMLSFPRELSPEMPESSSEEVKPVPLSQLDPTDPHGYKMLLPSVYKKQDLGVDESVANRRGVSRRRPFWPLNWGQSTRGTLRKVAQSHHSPRFVKTSRAPVNGHWKLTRFPQRHARHLHKTSKPVQGKAVLKHLEKLRLKAA